MDSELFKKAKEEKLSDVSRHMIRARLFEHIRNHPAGSTHSTNSVRASSPQVRDGVPGRFNNQRTIKLNGLQYKHMQLFAAIALMALMGGGTSFAAEGALPGDTLYSVKVGVNETVQGWFAVSTSAKAELEAKFASRRLEEAETLAATGRLKPEERSKIEAKFGAHTDKLGKLVADLRNKNDFESAADVSSDLEATLKAHGKILAKLNIVNGIAGRAALEAGDAHDERLQSEQAVASGSSTALRVAAESQAKVAEKAVLRARSSFNKNRGTMNAGATATFDSGLSIAEDKIVEGNAELSAGAYADAFMRFQDAKRIAREAQLLLRAHDELKIGGKDNEERGSEPTGAPAATMPRLRPAPESNNNAKSGVGASTSIQGGVNINAMPVPGTLRTETEIYEVLEAESDREVLMLDTEGSGALEVDFRL